MKTIYYFFFCFFMSFTLSSQNECSPNDAFTQACPITITNLTGQINGSINPDNDIDFYSFNIPRSCVITYSITNIPANIAIQADLYHESNQTTPVSSTSGVVGAVVTGVKKVCPAGKYFIKIQDDRTGTNQNSGLYNLKITLDTSDVYECNESFIACTPTSLNQDIKGAINSDNDIDYYCFNVPRAGVITYSITNVPANIAIQADLYYESSQATPLTSTSGAVGVGVTGVYKVCSAGKYFIKIQDDRTGTNQNSSLYNLKITFDTNDEYECNESFIACTPIPLNRDIKGAINSDNDIDYYCFNIPRAGVITYSISNVPANIAIQADLYHESNQTTRILSKSGSIGTSVTGVKKICLTGKYFIKLFDDRTGINQSPVLYNLKITLDTSDIYECNDNFLDAPSINCNTPIFASINSEDDIDCYKITLSKPDILTVSVTNVPQNLDPTITLNGPAPATTELRRVTGNTGQSVNLVSTTTLQAGTYYVCLTDTKANSNQYQLRVNCPSVSSIKENTAGEIISIFPNPTNEIISIEVKEFSTEGGIQAIEIYNTVGHLVEQPIISGQVKSQRVDISHLSKGVYVAKVFTNKGLGVLKFVKQ